LLKEAQARGADAIINVVIDKKIQVSTSPGSRTTTSVYFNDGGATASGSTGSTVAEPSTKAQSPVPTPVLKGIRQ
jgi:hypothetical protein